MHELLALGTSQQRLDNFLKKMHPDYPEWPASYHELQKFFAVTFPSLVRVVCH
jgi:hypothetical protein